jgi:hypothetical protein
MAATDFEIAKTLVAFLLRFNYSSIKFRQDQSPLGSPFHIYYEYQSTTDPFLCHGETKDM